MNPKTKVKLEEVLKKALLLERAKEKLLKHIRFYGASVTEEEAREIERIMGIDSFSDFVEELEIFEEYFLKEN